MKRPRIYLHTQWVALQKRNPEVRDPDLLKRAVGLPAPCSGRARETLHLSSGCELTFSGFWRVMLSLPRLLSIRGSLKRSPGKEGSATLTSKLCRHRGSPWRVVSSHLFWTIIIYIWNIIISAQLAKLYPVLLSSSLPFLRCKNSLL